LLGQVCGRSSLSFESVLRLVALIRSVGHANLTAADLMALIQGLPELDQVFTPMMKTGKRDSRKPAQSETRWPRVAAKEFGNGVVQSLQQNASDFFQYFARCKRSLLLSEWVRGTPMEDIEQRYSVNPFNAVTYGHVKGFADATRFHLRAVQQIA